MPPSAEAGSPATGRASQASFGDRLGHAFSLRENLRLLLVPPESRLRALDGWRALSILWVIVFHAGWYIGLHVPIQVYVALVFDPTLLPMWRGAFGVDVFFVLSGFLIAGMLIDEREREGRIGLGRFYLRRFLRLWPALLVMVILGMVITGEPVERVWPNLLYVSNFVPVLESRLAWTWSLSIEEQFYFVCPWLVLGAAFLRDSFRPAVALGVASLLCLVCGLVVSRGGFHAIDSEVVVNRPFLIWTWGYDNLYVKPWMRAGPLLMGVAGAYWFRMPRAMEFFERRRFLPVALLVMSWVAICVSMHWPLVALGPRPIEVIYLAVFRTVFGAGVAYTVVFSLSRHSWGALLGRWLSARWLYVIAQLAYPAYLLNPLVTEIVDGVLAPRLVAGGIHPLLVLIPAELLGTLLAAAVLHLAVERPIMRLRSVRESSGVISPT